MSYYTCIYACIIAYNERLLPASFHSKYAKTDCYSLLLINRRQNERRQELILWRTAESSGGNTTPFWTPHIGWFECKGWQKTKGKESMMGKHGCSVINNKGSKIVDVCQEKKFIIEGTGPFTDQYKIHRMVTRRVKLTEH